MQTTTTEPIESRIVALLKESPSINGTRISNLLDEDEVVVKNKLTMLVKDGVLFSEPGILEPSYHVSPLRTGWVIPTFKEMGQVKPAAPAAHAAPATPVVTADAAKLAELEEKFIGVHDSDCIEKDCSPTEEESIAYTVAENYTNKVDRAIAYLKSKGPGYVASSKELSLAMGLKQYGSAMNFLKYVVKKGIVCFHRYTGYWLPTESKVATESAPPSVKLKERQPLSLTASTPCQKQVLDVNNVNESLLSYADWVKQNPDGARGTLKTKAAASAPTPAVIETETPTHDPIHNPSHYTNGGIEFIEVLRAKLSSDEFRGFLKGNVIKYTLRAEHKDGAQDYAKGARYAKWLAEVKPSPRTQSKPLLLIPNVDLRELRKSVADGYKASSATMLDLIDFAIQHHQPT